MIYKIALIIIVINLFFEILENLFPIKNMNGIVRSFGRIIILYIICLTIFNCF